ncbi:hypothetical protein JW711_00955 [Candidatus Woesearchaeota archaeon]|nr:hypothetical protein [Candidatus Woesearchaeota archaeon]
MEEKFETYTPKRYEEDEWQLLDSYGEEPVEYHVEPDDLLILKNMLFI